MPDRINRFSRVFDLIDAANATDPNSEFDPLSRSVQPKELLYARRMSDMLLRFAPDAAETACIAARAQHIQRWEIPRSEYLQTTQGYKQWRTRLYQHHADAVATLMQQVGYDAESIEQVKNSVGKRGIKVNAESQLIEDVASLVFLAHYLQDFHARHPEYDQQKWRDILQKTWKKMSPAGRRFAQQEIALPPLLTPLLSSLTVEEAAAAT